ncbi:pilus assembly protein TadG-related protein [Tabrizicola sp.]|uniref:pilus assembly protein TadG-related protein n=1 Tax=Tabrizicola sp. TaxID=2005166 RepID=UPI00261B9BBD|nr:pilus assembly protein TadG-related protein [Tabrizicola sp.]MDM7933571.1 pilus assembly protein TadG-related protein [Tabrizicola sp.]
MKIRTPSTKMASSVAPFASEDDGGMTTFSLFGLVVCAMIGGIAVDISNLFRQKEHLTLAADAAAQAGIIALAEKKPATEIKTTALAAAVQNAPASVAGKIYHGEQDVELVRFDPKTRTLISGTPNAVKVTLYRDRSVENPVNTGLLRFAGVDFLEVTATSVAYYGQPGECTSSDGIYAKGQVTLTSGNWIGPTYCVHSQTGVWLPQQNFFEYGSGVSMPNLAACKSKCVDTANPGIEDAVFAMNLPMPSVADHISTVTSAMLGTSSDLKMKTDFFKGKEMNANLLEPFDKLKPTVVTSQLKTGSVVPLTAAQFNDLMFNTGGKLPTGLVYNVTCKDKGNGPDSWITIGGTTNRKNATESTTTIETISGVAVISNCGFDVGPNSRIDASLLISTRISSSSVIKAEQGAVIGDPLKNCDLKRKVYVMTMSGMSVNSDFTASNVAMIVNGDINVAANSSSSTVEHKGTSFHAEGSVHIPANHTFNSCIEDVSGLLPGIKTFKFVMPKA